MCSLLFLVLIVNILPWTKESFAGFSTRVRDVVCALKGRQSNELPTQNLAQFEVIGLNDAPFPVVASQGRVELAESFPSCRAGSEP